MKIVARYASKCGVCGQSIDIGDFVDWTKGQPARHLDCAAKPAPKAAARPRSLCPNPRDCGDPSCSGDCGY